MQDVPDEPLFTERVAGLDLAKTEVEVTIRVPGDTTPGLLGSNTRSWVVTCVFPQRHGAVRRRSGTRV